MPKEIASVRLPKLNGGINRFVNEAGADQCVSGLDVWARGGELQRRPAFKPIIAGPAYYLPAGSAYVAIERLSNNTFTEYAHRNPSFTEANPIGGLVYRLWIGCLVPFDGFEWRNLTAVPTAANFTATVHSWIRYLATGAALTTAYNVVDTTVKRQHVSSSAEWYSPLTQEGRISWNRDFFDNWTAQTKPTSGGTRYWIAVDLNTAPVEYGNTLSAVSMPFSTGTVTIAQRGIRCFLLNPINGLHHSKSKGLSPKLFIGADMEQKRGHVTGGGLGFLGSETQETENARLVEDEGAGTLGESVAPLWDGTTGVRGTVDTLTKDDRSYDWRAEQFDGAAKLSVTPSAGGSSTGIPVATSWEGTSEQNVENLRARVTVAAGAGPIVGTEREIIRSAANLIEVYPNWPAALDGGETIELRLPPSFARSMEGTREYEIDDNTAHVADLVYSNYTNEVGGADGDAVVSFEIFRECWWTLNPSRRWQFVFEPQTGNIILTNGENGLLEWDGRRLRRLQALYDATDGVEGAARVAAWRGIIADLAATLGVSLEQGSQLRRSPPNGKFICDFAARLVVANIRERQTTIQWSAPFDTNIWPLVNETQIRDSENNPITALGVIYDRLVVFTATSIHVAEMPNDRGEMFFRPLVQGVGCVSQAALAKINIGGASMLVFPGPDGIYGFDGSTARALLPDWSSVVENGVNDRCLERACGAGWLQENIYALGIPSRGSDKCDRVIMMDYSASPPRFWAFSTPTHVVSASASVINYVTSIARELDESGRERLLFGMDDGHVCVLADHLRDGGESITGTARAKPLEAAEMAAFSSVHLSLRAMGTGPSLTCAVYRERSDRVAASIARVLSSDTLDALYGTSLYNTTGAQFAAPRIRDFVFNLPAETIGEALDFEISSTERFRFNGGSLFFTPKGARQAT